MCVSVLVQALRPMTSCGRPFRSVCLWVSAGFVHAPGRVAPHHRGGAVVQLAGHERLATRASLPRSPYPDFGGVHAQGDAFGGGVGEHVGKGV